MTTMFMSKTPKTQYSGDGNYNTRNDGSHDDDDGDDVHRTKGTITTDTDQDDPDYDPGREEDGDTAVQAMIHAIPETLQPGANQRRVQSAVQQL